MHTKRAWLIAGLVVFSSFLTAAQGTDKAGWVAREL